MKKGFTLIELLAVVIILAVIAIIAIPIITNVIKDSKKSVAQTEANTILSGITNYCAREEMMAYLNADAEILCNNNVIPAADVSKMVNLGKARMLTDVTVAGDTYGFIVESNGYEIEIQNGLVAAVDGETTGGGSSENLGTGTTYAERISELETRVTSLTGQISGLATESTGYGNQINDLNSQTNSLITSNANLVDRVNTLNDQYNNLAGQVTALSNQVNSMQSSSGGSASGIKSIQHIKIGCYAGRDDDSGAMGRFSSSKTISTINALTTDVIVPDGMRLAYTLSANSISYTSNFSSYYNGTSVIYYSHYYCGLATNTYITIKLIEYE